MKMNLQQKGNENRLSILPRARGPRSASARGGHEFGPVLEVHCIVVMPPTAAPGRARRAASLQRSTQDRENLSKNGLCRSGVCT
jgi:hypothetical protein